MNSEKSQSVVELNGKPYIRNERNATTPRELLTHGLTQLTSASLVGEVQAMYGIAEVFTSNGPQLIIIKYGVPTNYTQSLTKMMEVTHAMHVEAHRLTFDS